MIFMRKNSLSQYKQASTGISARIAAELVGVNKNTAAYCFHCLRLFIYQNSPPPEMFNGEVEADESYFGGYRKGSMVVEQSEKSQYSGF